VGKTHVQPVASQFSQLFGRTQFAQFQPQTGVAGLECLQHLRQAPVQHGAHKPNSQVAGLAQVHIAHMLQGLVRLGQQCAGLWNQRLTRSRELHRFAVAQKKPCTHGGLQLLDGHAQRRLRHAQALGGTAKVQLFGQGQKITKVAQLHEFDLAMAE
jgi:hypothetical protein